MVPSRSSPLEPGIALAPGLASVHSLSPPFGGRPRLRCSGAATFIPRRASASRSSTSIWALTLRKSAAALRSSATHKAGSMRSGNAFFGLGDIEPASALLVERAGVDDGLGLALAAQDDHKVRDHRRLALVVELDHALLGQHLQRR